MSKNIRDKRFYVILSIVFLIVCICSHWLYAVGVTIVIWILSHLLDEEDVPAPRSCKNVDLWDHPNKRNAEVLKEKIDAVLKDAEGVVAFNDLLAIGGVEDFSMKTFPKRDLDKLIHSLGKLGYGIVPNCQLGQKRLTYGDVCVLYRKSSVTCDYLPDTIHKSEIFLKLFSVILSGNRMSPADSDYVKKSLKALPHKDVYDEYLYAYMLWLTQKKQIYDKKSKDEVAELPTSSKKNFAQLLLNSVYVNGDIDNQRVVALKKILPTLDFNPDSVHSLIHQTLTDDSVFATVEKAEEVREYTIRRPGMPAEKPVEKPEQKPLLDLEKLNELKEQTRIAQGLLSEIFVPDEEETMVPVSSGNNDFLLEVLGKLFEKEVWKRSEIAGIVGPDVMVGNLLEQINDYACEKIDDIVVEEDGDDVYVIMEYKEQFI